LRVDVDGTRAELTGYDIQVNETGVWGERSPREATSDTLVADTDGDGPDDGEESRSWA